MKLMNICAGVVLSTVFLMTYSMIPAGKLDIEVNMPLNTCVATGKKDCPEVKEIKKKEAIPQEKK